MSPDSLDQYVNSGLQWCLDALDPWLRPLVLDGTLPAVPADWAALLSDLQQPLLLPALVFAATWLLARLLLVSLWRAFAFLRSDGFWKTFELLWYVAVLFVAVGIGLEIYRDRLETRIGLQEVLLARAAPGAGMTTEPPRWDQAPGESLREPSSAAERDLNAMGESLRLDRMDLGRINRLGAPFRWWAYLLAIVLALRFVKIAAELRILRARRLAGASPSTQVKAHYLTAGGGQFIYRVIAERQLTDDELQSEVLSALEDGRLLEPAAGGMATLILN